MILDIGLGNGFLDMTPKAKIGKWYHTNEKTSAHKGNNQQSEKATYRIGENIFKPYG